MAEFQMSTKVFGHLDLNTVEPLLKDSLN